MARTKKLMWSLYECVGKLIDVFSDVLIEVTAWLLETKIETHWVDSDTLRLFKLLLFVVATVSAKLGNNSFLITGIIIALAMLYAFLLVIEEYAYSHTAHMSDFANAYCLLTLSICGVKGLDGLWYLVLWIFINYIVAAVLDAWDKRRGCYI